MLGNDLVDLNLAARQSNWRRKNYLAKIFTAREQEMVHQAENPDLLVWCMWSMKEAAYKIVNRSTGLRTYNPKAFSCYLDPEESLVSGTVGFQNEVFKCNTTISQGVIHTVAMCQE